MMMAGTYFHLIYLIDPIVYLMDPIDLINPDLIHLIDPIHTHDLYHTTYSTPVRTRCRPLSKTLLYYGQKGK